MLVAVQVRWGSEVLCFCFVFFLKNIQSDAAWLKPVQDFFFFLTECSIWEKIFKLSKPHL